MSLKLVLGPRLLLTIVHLRCLCWEACERGKWGHEMKGFWDYFETVDSWLVHEHNKRQARCYITVHFTCLQTMGWNPGEHISNYNVLILKRVQTTVSKSQGYKNSILCIFSSYENIHTVCIMITVYMSCTQDHMWWHMQGHYVYKHFSFPFMVPVCAPQRRISNLKTQVHTGNLWHI